MTIINSRADLDAIAGTPEHVAFIAALKGSLTHNEDTAKYPENYDKTLTAKQRGFVAPVIRTITDDAQAVRFGFTCKELEPWTLVQPVADEVI